MRKDTDFVLEILFFVSIGCKTSFIFLSNLSTLRSCVRAKAIVGALLIKTLESFYKEATCRRPTRSLRMMARAERAPEMSKTEGHTQIITI